MTSRRKSIGRGDEASGPIINPAASASMSRGESREKLQAKRRGKSGSEK